MTDDELERTIAELEAELHRPAWQTLEEFEESRFPKRTTDPEGDQHDRHDHDG